MGWYENKVWCFKCFHSATRTVTWKGRRFIFESFITVRQSFSLSFSNSRSGKNLKKPCGLSFLNRPARSWPCSVKLWTAPRTETPQYLWTTCSSVWPLSWWKKKFSFWNYCLLSLIPSFCISENRIKVFHALHSLKLLTTEGYQFD